MRAAGVGCRCDATMRQRRELGGAQVTRTAADVGQSANQIPIQPLRLGTVPSRAGSWGFSFGREEGSGKGFDGWTRGCKGK